MLSKLRSKEQTWKKLRWWLLITSVANVGIGIWLLVYILQIANAANHWDGGIVWFCPVSWWMFIQGVLLCTATLAKWSGDPIVLLLLRLFEQNDTAPGAGSLPATPSRTHT